MTPLYSNEFVTLYHGDCLDVMRDMEPSSVDAIVTDPPYGLSFMGRDWAHGVPGEHFWLEALKVAKPGAHLVAFGGTRTYHRLAVAIEDAGWEIRNGLGWLYGSGFPKSLDVSKAIDKRPGVTSHEAFAAHLIAKREESGLSRADVSESVVGSRSGACWNWEHHQFPVAKWWPALRDLLNLDAQWGAIIADAERDKTGERDANMLAVAPGQGSDRSATTLDITAPATEAAARWEGYGTALKPAWEPIILARKPLGSTVAKCVQTWGTGALNIDGCRVKFAGEDDMAAAAAAAAAAQRSTADQNVGHKAYGDFNNGAASLAPYLANMDKGRWPANIVHDGSPEVLAVFPQTTSTSGEPRFGKAGNGYGMTATGSEYDDSGSAARFFYTAKATTAERDDGLHGFATVSAADLTGRAEGSPGLANPRASQRCARKNTHPTVKPLALMRWLVRLVTPPGGIVLDPFMGSGTTLKAARAEGFKSVGIDLDREYCDIALGRMSQGVLL